MRRRGATAPVVQPARRGAPLAEQEANERKLRQKVQVARKQMALSDEAYRDIIARVCAGKTSSTACGASDLVALLDEFKRLGWQGGGRPISQKAQVRKIRAVYADLKPFLITGDESTLRAFCRRQAGVDAPEFLDSKAANKVLEGLKAWLNRERAKRAAIT